MKTNNLSKENSTQSIEPKKISPIADSPLHFLGKNQKLVSIIVNEPNVEHIKQVDLDFLITILNACSLALPDIAVVNVAQQAVNINLLKAQLSPAYLLLFDVSPSELKIPFIAPAFQVQNYDGYKIIVSPPLSLLNQPDDESKDLRKSLWVALKKMFDIVKKA